MADLTEEQFAALAEFKKKYKDFTLLELVTELRDLRVAADDAKAFSNSQLAVYEIFSKQVVPARMEDEGMEQLTVEGIGRVNIRTDIYCSTKEGMGIDLKEWMKEHDMEDIITDVINASTLKAWVKEQMKAGNDVPEELLNIVPYDRAVITKK